MERKAAVGVRHFAIRTAALSLAAFALMGATITLHSSVYTVRPQSPADAQGEVRLAAQGDVLVAGEVMNSDAAYLEGNLAIELAGLSFAFTQQTPLQLHHAEVTKSPVIAAGDLVYCSAEQIAEYPPKKGLFKTRMRDMGFGMVMFDPKRLHKWCLLDQGSDGTFGRIFLYEYPYKFEELAKADVTPVRYRTEPLSPELKRPSITLNLVSFDPAKGKGRIALEMGDLKYDVQPFREYYVSEDGKVVEYKSHQAFDLRQGSQTLVSTPLLGASIEILGVDPATRRLKYRIVSPFREQRFDVVDYRF